MQKLITQALSEKSAEIAGTLQQQGWWSGQLLPISCVEALLADAKNLHSEQQFQPAAIGAQHNKVISQTVRGDETCWIDGSTPAQRMFLDGMQELKHLLESCFPVRLNNFDGHYSYYPVGTFYRKHRDNARQSNSRIFSIVNYLNPDWQNNDGGELVLFQPETGMELISIQPVFGTTVIFLSADFPHEVRETRKARFSLTGWFHQRHNPL